MSEPGNIVRATDDRAAERPLSTAVGIGRGRRAASVSTPHSHKFRAATATLAGIAVAAIVIAIVVAAQGDHGSTSAKWSAWKPVGSGSQGAREIADHIAPFYRISGTDQLDLITVLNLANPSTVSTTTGTSSGGLQVAVRPDLTTSQVSLLSGSTVAYNLCGIGSNNCSIGIGTPSSDRLLLLRRQALELALYTFKYISGVDNVVAVLPPGHTPPTSTLTAKPPSASPAKTTTQPLNAAVLFVKAELSPWLGQPLSTTLTEFPPTVPQLSLWHQSPEAGLVDQITARGLFSEKLVTAQDGSSLIVLDPLPPQ